MTGSHQIDVISAIETSHPVGAIRFRDFEVWPIVRMMLDRDRAAMMHAPVSRRRRARDVVASLAQWSVSRHAVDHTKPSVVFLDQRSSRMRTPAGGYVDTFAAPLRRVAEAADTNLVVWDWRDVRDARPGPADARPIDWFLARATIKAAAERRRPPAQHLRTELTELEPIVRQHGAAFDVDEALTRVLVVDSLGDGLGSKLTQLSPSLAFVMCFYGTPGLGFTLACRRRGVLSVDLQHGVQGPLHLAYGRWLGDPGPESALVPDRFWTWTDADAAWIDEAFGAGRAEVGGNLAFDAIPATAGVRDQRFAREILVTLQPNTPVLPEVVEAMRTSPADWRWWVRPHPTTTVAVARAALPDDVDGHIEIERAASLPLASLLDAADAHVTAYSSVVLEAASRGVVSFVARDAVDFFPAQARAGFLAPIISAPELRDGLARARRVDTGASMAVRPAAFEHLLATAAAR